MRCPLFARIAPNDVFALTECLGAAERRYERGEALWLTGDAVSACAVVLSGGVRAESLLPSGERSLTAVHGPGALVGDVLMATRDKKSPVDVIAAQNTAALFLPYRAMMASCAHACEQHALLRENLLAEIAEKVGYESQSKLTAAFKSAYGVLPSEYRKEKKENSRP